MRTIGLLGGMSWESTSGYYRAINQGVREVLGGLHSAKIALYSVDFEPLEQWQHADDWAAISKHLTGAALSVQAAGADCLLICTNTMHKVAPHIEQSLDIPLIHIADATAEALKAQGVDRVGLLGTAFTMEQDFYRGRLTGTHGIDVLVPEKNERELVHRVIYEELCLGQTHDGSRQAFLRVIDSLAARGAQGVILGCTEIGMLVGQQDTPTPLFDTTAIHARKAVEWALSGPV
ncbi:MAG: aspartate/glutamate racemase family protein [Pseudohongiellaceae bacterium]